MRHSKCFQVEIVETYAYVFRLKKAIIVDYEMKRRRILTQLVDNFPCFSLSPNRMAKSTTIGFNSFLTSSNFCCVLTIFANSLDPDQASRL